nr:hypothetical protein [Tanacetum cinerariifolium]
MVEEVTFLKKDFKQKENKYLEDFLDMKSLKEKVEDRLLKQDQSLQTVHVLCRPKPYYNELNKVAIGYKNPLFLTHAKKVQPALNNGHEIIKDNHVPAIIKQHYKELYDSIQIIHAKHIEQVTALTTENVNLKAQILEKVNTVCKDKVKPKVLTQGKHVIDIEPIVPHLRNNRDAHLDYLRHLKESGETIHDIVEEAKVIKQHYKELYDSIQIIHAKHIEQVTALTTKNVNLKAQILEKVNTVCKDKVKPKVLTQGKHVIDVEPIVPHLRNNRDAHLNYLRHLKESVETIRDIVEEAKV